MNPYCTHTNKTNGHQSAWKNEKYNHNKNHSNGAHIYSVRGASRAKQQFFGGDGGGDGGGGHGQDIFVMRRFK